LDGCGQGGYHHRLIAAALALSGFPVISFTHNMTSKSRSRTAARIALLMLWLCAQLFTPAHALDHDSNADSGASCTVCPVGQNLTGVCSDLDLPVGFLIPATTPDHLPVPDVDTATLTLFNPRAPPPLF